MRSLIAIAAFAFALLCAATACKDDASPQSAPVDAGDSFDGFAPEEAGPLDAALRDADAEVDAPPPEDAGPLARAAHGAIVVDGLANEPVWKAAAPVSFDTDYSGKATGVATHVRFSWSESGLALFASVEDTGLFVDQSKATNVDRPKLYDEDCIELFFTPSAATPNRYFEMEVGPYGHFLDLDVNLSKGTYDTTFSSGLVVSTKVDVAGRHADIEALFKAKEIASLLAAGASFRIGLFRLEGKTNDPNRLFLAWSPPKTAKPNFHVPTAFGRLLLLP